MDANLPRVPAFREPALLSAACRERADNYYWRMRCGVWSMASSVDLGNLEQSVERLVASGRYNSKSEVLREGVRLVEEREKRL